MSARVITGDCRAVLPTLPANGVHCVVTSPPYYGLRDYGTAQWDGGDAGCSHDKAHSMATSGLEGGKTTTLHAHYYRDLCGKCGARRIDSQIGLEATPEDYIATLVAVFREVRRVLRSDGCVFLNIGDSYAGGNSVGWRPGNPDKNGGNSNRDGVGVVPGLAAKQLLMVPARVALALQADGWWVRSDIIWAKPNPMPESVTDRPTSAHEHVFLLTKSPRYYYDADAIAEPATHAGKIVATNGNDGMDEGFDGHRTRDGFRRGVTVGATRKLRNVWMIATSPFADAHFATFPSALVERCIKAGTSERGCCAGCGAPWVRVIETSYRNDTTTDGRPAIGNNVKGGQEQGQKTFASGVRTRRYDTTTGWRASCACPEALPVPCTVLDPFAGAGTTLLVADRLQRDGIGIELNGDYVAMARGRVVADAPLLAAVS